MKSLFKERFERLGQVKDVNRVPSGSPAIIKLEAQEASQPINVVMGALSLTRRGMTMLHAKRAMEQLAARSRVIVRVPTVEDRKAFAEELASAGMRASVVAERDVDVAALRHSLRLTQAQFALEFGLDEDAVRNWEQKRRAPDVAAKSYLRAIEFDPEAARRAQEDSIEVKADNPSPFYRNG